MRLYAFMCGFPHFMTSSGLPAKALSDQPQADQPGGADEDAPDRKGREATV
jgi:hypothetical protein